MNVTELVFAVLRSEITNVPLDERTKNYINAETAQSVYQMMKAHDLSHFLSDAFLKNGLFVDTPNGKKKLIQHRNRAVCRYEQMQYEIDAIVGAFEEAGIPHVLLKGATLRGEYPERWMRTSCDVDILVAEEHLSKAGEALCGKLGYTQGEKGSHDVRFTAESGVNLELHYSLIEEAVYAEASKILQDVWQHVEKKDGANSCFVLTDEFAYFYHVAHMAKHFANGGCGVRSVLDLWLLNRRGNPHRETLLKEGRLSSFEEALRALSEVWFSGAEPTDLTRETGKFILRGGIYGTMENRVAVQQTKKGGKFRYAMSRIFLPYESLRFYYPSLQGRKWLTPIYQVRRWGRLIFCGGMKRSLKELETNGSIPKEKREQTLALLEKLGI